MFDLFKKNGPDELSNELRGQPDQVLQKNVNRAAGDLARFDEFVKTPNLATFVSFLPGAVVNVFTSSLFISTESRAILAERREQLGLGN